MRAIKATLLTAYSIKTAFPQSNEETIILKALRSCNLPKLLSTDVPLFEGNFLTYEPDFLQGILSDIFPGGEAKDLENDILIHALRESCSALGLTPNGLLLDKCLQLYDTAQVGCLRIC